MRGLQYWDCLNTRNEERYDNTISHGRNYDSKNTIHVFRLLNMAEEIARYKEVNVRRSEREYLLKVRADEFQYHDLVDQAEEKTKPFFKAKGLWNQLPTWITWSGCSCKNGNRVIRFPSRLPNCLMMVYAGEAVAASPA
jgi:hypothetical protein